MGVGWFLSLFYFFGGDGTDRAGLGGGCIPRRYTPAHSSAPGRTAHDRQQHRPHTGTHARTLDTLHRSALNTRQAAWGRSGRCRGLEGLRGASETVQIWTHSNMNDFQHKNVCKTIDTNTRMCYYIYNTRTCYTTTKTGGQKP